MHRVRALLMGGQACIVYGGAEFSRDVDFAVDPGKENLRKLRAALSELDAESAYFPPLSSAALRKGHACHFRCRIPEANGLRVDLMSKMRGVDGFNELWRRRATRRAGESPLEILLLSLPDLVRAKKTQRDKDWPMIRRMIDADILSTPRPKPKQVRFWLEECRTPELILSLIRKYPAAAKLSARKRPAIRIAIAKGAGFVQAELLSEEQKEREIDREYWRPLKEDLERMRRSRPK